jgi:UDP-N-acetylmuramate--alanine ligase
VAPPSNNASAQQPDGALTVLVAAGGTAGHLVPALAVARELVGRGHRVEFVTSHGPRDRQAVEATGYDVHTIPVTWLPSRPGMRMLIALVQFALAIPRSAALIARVRPDVVLTGGGFVAAPVALGAWLRRVPVVATEADAHLGRANRIAGRVARTLCVAFPLPAMRRKQVHTGRPVAAGFFATDRAAARSAWGIGGDDVVLVAFGGSGGATRLNEAVHGAFAAESDPRAGDRSLRVLHVAGRRDFARLDERARASDRYRLIEYCDDMPSLLAAADLVVARAGGSVWELAAVGAPAVLVPFPHATGDHQRLNGEYFQRHGAAVLIGDDECVPARVRALAREWLVPAADEHRTAMGEAMRRLAMPDAATAIARQIERAGGFDPDDVDHLEEPLHGNLSGRTLHMMGIGGAGVSALAQLCSAWGAMVTGCDRARSPYIDMVEQAGIPVAIGHSAAHVVEGSELVMSSAIAQDHPEVARARELGVPTILRGELLGQLTQLRRTIVVAGAHGKSTTTSMIAHVMTEAGLDPAMALGAESAQLGGNVRTGSEASAWFVVEGDESDKTLLSLRAKIAVITNIERDHHHTFASDDEVIELFEQWVANLSDDALLVAGPGPVLDRVVASAPDDVRVVRFGDDEAAIREIGDGLAVPGRHNALNAAAALAVCDAVGVDREVAAAALATYQGIGRRFELIGEAGGIRVVDDYSHHPTEVAAAIQAARERVGEGRVVVIFQPHLYSRTQALADEFVDALAGADQVALLPVYGAREDPIDGVDAMTIGQPLADAVGERFWGVVDVDPATGDVASIAGRLMHDDLVITMGAGDVTRLAPRLVDALGGGSTAGEATGDDPPEFIERDVPLNKSTTIGTGGSAAWFAKVQTEPQLVEALAWAHGRGLPVATIGLGSNSLIADAGFDGLLVRLAGELAAIDIDAESGVVTAGGGASLAAIVRLCREAGLTGFEFGCAIPGTIGGAVKMNAGAYGGEMVDVLPSARLVGPGGARDVAAGDLGMRYRHSDVAWGDIVSQGVLQLAHDDPEAIKARVKDMQARRSDTQPRAARSFGSVFQNPTEPPAGGDEVLGAGALIERAGLKGHTIGGACISPKHGNFIENLGTATTADIVALIELARAAVREQSGVTLHTEVHLLDRAAYRPLLDDLASVDTHGAPS